MLGKRKGVVARRGPEEAPVANIQRGRKHYLACRRKRVDDIMATVDALVRDGDWVVSIRNRVSENAEVLPFTGWFDPDSAVELMSGELVVIAAFRHLHSS